MPLESIYDVEPRSRSTVWRKMAGPSRSSTGSRLWARSFMVISPSQRIRVRSSPTETSEKRMTDSARVAGPEREAYESIGVATTITVVGANTRESVDFFTHRHGGRPARADRGRSTPGDRHGGPRIGLSQTPR